MKDLHLSVTLEEEFSSDIAAGRVTRTDPEADEILTVGQTVTLWISKGPRPISPMVGMPLPNKYAHMSATAAMDTQAVSRNTTCMTCSLLKTDSNLDR